VINAIFDNSLASTGIIYETSISEKMSKEKLVLQVNKSQRWMPWCLMPMKDVGGCEKPRGAADQASIRGCPNGETQHVSLHVIPA
jgi:hypothetical protein